MVSVVVATALAGVLLAAFTVAGFAGPPRLIGPSRWIAHGLVALGVVAALQSSAFDGYDTDYWSYAIVVERVASGESVWNREPFRLEPPPNTQVSPYWILMGRLKAATGLSTNTLIRMVGVLVAIGLWAAATRLARCLLPDRDLSWVAVPLFWLSIPDQWWSLGLGRSVSLVFALLAAGSVLQWKGDGRSRSGRVADALSVAALLALSFHAHVFGGVVAIGASALAAAARWRRGDPVPVATFLLALLLTLLLAWPSLGRAVETAGLPRNPGHLGPRGGRETLGGVSFMAPSAFLGLLPVPMFLLAAIGLFRAPAASEALARTLAALGTLACLIAFFTPAYHAAATVFGGWLVVRLAVLAFPWISSTLGTAGLLRSSLAARALCGALLLWLCTGVALQLAGSLIDRDVDLRRPPAAWTRHYLRATPEAQAEARRLRGVLKGRTYISADVLAYGTAATTLGHPLAIPPGHASPFDDVARRKRRVDRALVEGTAACWEALFRRYPNLAFLITPAPGAEVENDAWNRRLAVAPQDVRHRLQEMGALEPAFFGRYLVLDRIRLPDRIAPSDGAPAEDTCS